MASADDRLTLHALVELRVVLLTAAVSATTTVVLFLIVVLFFAVALFFAMALVFAVALFFGEALFFAVALFSVAVLFLCLFPCSATSATGALFTPSSFFFFGFVPPSVFFRE
jgi:hypothetical protein